MAGNSLFEEHLRLTKPHTYAALQKLIMAMADVRKNTGKTTWFGRDRGQIAYSHFLLSLKVTMQSMVLDGVIRPSTTTVDAIVELTRLINIWKMAFPNWQDAYGFADFFFVETESEAIATIERLRSIP